MFSHSFASEKCGSPRTLIPHEICPNGHLVARWNGIQMKKSNSHLFKRSALVAAYGFFGSLIFMRFLRNQPIIDDGDLLTALLVSVLLSVSVMLSERLVIPRTRRMRLVPAVFIRAGTLTVTSVGSVFFGVLFANVLQDGWESALVRFSQLIESGEVTWGSGYAMLIMLILVFFSSISQKMGPGVLRNWMLGRYHEPRVEECVFMFLDMCDSTGLAERLGDAKFSSLIRDVFSDITPSLLKYNAQISHYIGDEVVLYWPVRQGKKPDPSFAHCFFSVRDLLLDNAHRYEDRFGVVPKFKAGAHGGNVIVTEVGEIKSEFVFHGDVLNITSRLERLCSEESTDFLISSDLASALTNERGLVLTNIGERALKGKGQAITVFSVSRDSD